MTRHGKDAVIVVSEADWEGRRAKADSTLADLLLETIGKGGVADVLVDRSWYRTDRPLGADFTD